MSRSVPGLAGQLSVYIIDYDTPPHAVPHLPPGATTVLSVSSRAAITTDLAVCHRGAKGREGYLS